MGVQTRFGIRTRACTIPNAVIFLPFGIVEGINGWPGPDGKAFRMGDYQRLGTQAVLDAVNWLWNESPEGEAWKASPAVVPFLPKSAPAMFPLSR